MKVEKYLGGMFVLFAMISVVLLSSCAGSRDDSLMIDEEAFASESSQTESSEDPTPEEEEVLKLLGISKEDDLSPASQQTAQGGVSADNAKGLESKLDNLENEVKYKNVELANLKAELTERDQRITNLQRELSTPGTSSAPVRIPGVGSSFKDKYNQALALYNSRRYKEAIRMFDDLLAMNQTNSLVDNCQYWKGECYYAQLDYNQAIIEFEKVFVYSNSNKYDDAQLKLGLCYTKLGNTDRARAEFEKVISNYPDSEYVQRAQYYLQGF